MREASNGEAQDGELDTLRKAVDQLRQEVMEKLHREVVEMSPKGACGSLIWVVEGQLGGIARLARLTDSLRRQPGEAQPGDVFQPGEVANIQT